MGGCCEGEVVDDGGTDGSFFWFVFWLLRYGVFDLDFFDWFFFHLNFFHDGACA